MIEMIDDTIFHDGIEMGNAEVWSPDDQLIRHAESLNLRLGEMARLTGTIYVHKSHDRYYFFHV
jgi:hypothetical protein